MLGANKIKSSFGYKPEYQGNDLASLRNVSNTQAVNGNILSFNSTSDKWEPTAASGGGSPGGADKSVQFNDGGSFNGISGISTNGTTSLEFATGSGAFFKDGASIAIGTGNDYVLTHSGGGALVQNSTGKILTFNASASDDIVFKLGNNTTATKFSVQNLASQTILELNGDGNVVIPNGTLGVRDGFFKRTTIHTINTAGDVIYTGNQLFGGYLKRDPDGVNRNDTTPSAAVFLGLFGTGKEVGSSFDFTIKNTSSVGGIDVTLVPGSGVTIDGTTVIPTGSVFTFKVVMTNVGSGTEACTILDM